MRRPIVLILLILASILPVEAASNECLIVRSAEGHRFRNAMIAGVLTGGIGLAAGAAFSGGKYEYADSFNVPNTKPKYSGKELEKLQREGLHIIVVNKKTASQEMDSARNSCKTAIAPVEAPASAPVAAGSPTAPAVAPASYPMQNAPAQPTVQPAVNQTVTYQPESLGDAARQAKAQKQQQPQPPQ